jgi:hypothetical protein
MQPLTVSVKGERRKNLIENHTPFSIVSEIYSETSSLENSQDYAQKPQLD